MAKMSERQREYFLSRVNDEIYNHKRSLELKESSAKEKMVKKLYPKYVEQVGLKKDLAELQTLETKYNRLLNHMDSTISRMFKAEELYMHDRNGNYVYPEYEKVIKELKKTNCYKKPHEGYDEYYLTVGNTKVKSVDLSELSADAKTSDIKKLF